MTRRWRRRGRRKLFLLLPVSALSRRILFEAVTQRGFGFRGEWGFDAC